jgi:hypothetical protein
MLDLAFRKHDDARWSAVRLPQALQVSWAKDNPAGAADQALPGKNTATG